MKTNATAQKVQAVTPTMTIVEKTAVEKSAKVINFKASAEDVKSEEVKKEVKVQETKAEEVKTAPVAEPITEKPVQSIEDIKRKSEVLSRLAKKYDDLIDKRNRVEDFVISHDHETASVKVRDAMNYTFESNSPKTIGKLLEFWKFEFSEAIANVEKEMREIA